MNKKLLIFMVVILFGIAGLKAQDLDRISLSAGGASTDQVNYVIGETFNFAMSDSATVTIETGTLGSTDYTGGDNNFTNVKIIAESKPLACYPNPANDILFFTTAQNTENNLIITIYDISGKVVIKQNSAYANIMKVSVNNLVSGTYFLSVSDRQNNLIGSTKFVKQ